ncbi:NADH dehydrogenase [ubiquinone] 1 beta subcomplex subunit 5, mitochondrial [Euwallacea similis]|uniref:NADH dehydrogenase [ubiquinone] 1 beta subcomplex subunit 5, mitochondrial n=1 Tax=Euwallacea similis TaxID=1736056 RepID=UPI00344B1A66
MTLLSKLRPLFKHLKSVSRAATNRQMSEHRTLSLEPSRFQWTKFKDYIHFYVLLGIIPCSLFVTGMNVFIGPGTLSEIPEGYTPKYWEYYKNPVTRFLTRYLFNNPQQDYEKFLTYIFVEHEKIRLRQLEKEIVQKMGERFDYQAYYFRPPAVKYYRLVREGSDEVEKLDDPLPKE